MDNGISYGNAMHLITIFSIADLLVKPVPGKISVCANYILKYFIYFVVICWNMSAVMAA